MIFSFSLDRIHYYTIYKAWSDLLIYIYCTYVLDLMYWHTEYYHIKAVQAVFFLQHTLLKHTHISGMLIYEVLFPLKCQRGVETTTDTTFDLGLCWLFTITSHIIIYYLLSHYQDKLPTPLFSSYHLAFVSSIPTFFFSTFIEVYSLELFFFLSDI